MRISDWSSDVCSSDLIDGVSELYNQNPRITQVLNNIPLFLYLVSAVFILPRFIRKYPSIFSQMLLLSLVPAIFAQLCMVYGSFFNFDNYFNIAHYEKFVTYLIPFLGISLNYQQMHRRSEEHTSELQSLMRTSYAVFCLK